MFMFYCIFKKIAAVSLRYECTPIFGSASSGFWFSTENVDVELLQYAAGECI